jgi:3-hydroxy acid dehydrogenase/malonic semialdehyde reductase
MKVFITGASSGFGRSMAYEFSKAGHHLILNARREDKLLQLQENLTNQFGNDVRILVADLRDRKMIFEAIKGMGEFVQDVDVLVNNAGLAVGRDYFDEAEIDDWERMIDTNLKGLLYVTKAIVPYMIKRRKGHIINIGSTAGKEVYEKGNVYCATKHSVGAVSQAMRIDLLRHRIRVTVVHPGAAETEFSVVRFKGDEELAKRVYEGYQPLSASDVAGVVLYCSSLPEHVCINEIVMTATAQANSFYLQKD